MPTERVAGPQRRLEVDLVAFGQIPERGAGDALRDRRHRETAVLHRGGRQAAAVDVNRVPDRGESRSLGSFDLDVQAALAAPERHDAAALAHDAGEHSENRLLAEGEDFDRLAGDHLHVAALAGCHLIELLGQLLDRLDLAGAQPVRAALGDLTAELLVPDVPSEPLRDDRDQAILGRGCVQGSWT